MTMRGVRRSWRAAPGVLVSTLVLAACASTATASLQAGASPGIVPEPTALALASPTAAPFASSSSTVPPSPSPAFSDALVTAGGGPLDVTWDVAARPATGRARDWEALGDQAPVWTTLGDRTVMVIGYDTTPQTWSSKDGIHWTASRLPG